jgi:beta-lactamase superfamily II metal-dependent hydrolase
MASIEFIDDDIVTISRDNGTEWELYWGDPVHRFPTEDVPTTESVVAGKKKQKIGRLRVATHDREGNLVMGFISADVKLRPKSILRFSMIDVQQGDGMIIETPEGKVIFIDGGDNKLFARHAAARYAGSMKSKPQPVDAIIITHGDADHFEGLTAIKVSESDGRPGKALFIAPKRVFHNGMVKRPGKFADDKDRPDVAMFGATKTVSDQLYATELVDDPRSIAETERNEPFNGWCKALDHWDRRCLEVHGAPLNVRRLDHLSDPATAFDFLVEDNISVELFGPIVEDVDGVPGVPFLRKPSDDAWLMTGIEAPPQKGSYSASHTINGHSINMRLRFGNVHFLLTGDMNQESMARTRTAIPGINFKSEILKAPHHGSADFDQAFLEQASPVVSLISSGDESVAKEHIHPRATLMAGLGKASRGMPAIIFNTELAAFFAYRGWSVDQEITAKQEAGYEGFERLNFGIIHIRTNGERVLAFTHSGKRGLNEAYRFDVDVDGKVTFASKVSKRAGPKI